MDIHEALGGKMIEDREVIPQGFGAAYRPYDRRVFYVYPWPINHLVNAVICGWAKVRHARGKPMVPYAHMRKIERDAYERGLEDGKWFVNRNHWLQKKP